MSENQIYDLEQLKRTYGHGDLFPEELRILSSFAFMIARQKSAPKYLEIGIFGGGTIHFLRAILAERHLKLSCTGVDLFEDFKLVADNTHSSGNYTMADVQDFLGPEVRLLKGNSDHVLPELAKANEKFDLIFIDGNHTYEACRRDLINSLPLLADDGYVAFHNSSAHEGPDWDEYNRTDGGPWQVVTELKLDGNLVLACEVRRVAVFTRKRGKSFIPM